MRRVAISLSAFVFSIALAEARPRAIHPQPTAAAVGTVVEEDGVNDPARAAAKARQDSFDRRILSKSDKAVRSICSGCDGAAAKARSNGPKRTAGAVAMPDEPVLDEAGESAAE